MLTDPPNITLMSGGPEASGILMEILEGEPICDEYMRVILRGRMMDPNPGDACLPCQHVRVGQKTICGKHYKGDFGRHPLNC